MLLETLASWAQIQESNFFIRFHWLQTCKPLNVTSRFLHAWRSEIKVSQNTSAHCSEKYSARFPPLNGRLHVMVLTFCLQPKGPRCVGHVWQHPSNLLVLRSPILTPQKRSYFSLAHLGLPSFELAFAKEQCR